MNLERRNVKKRTQAGYVLLPLALMLFAMPFSAIQYKVPSILQSLVIDLPMGTALAPWLISSFVFAGILMTLLASPLVKKTGLRPAVVIAAALAISGSGIGAFLHQPLLLVISRMLEGAGFGIICVAGPLIIEARIPVNHRGLANGIWGIWLPAGAFIGEVVAPTIYASPLGFAGLWLTLALPLLPLLLIVLVTLGSKTKLAEEQREPTPRKRGFGELGIGFALFLVAWLSFNILNFALMSYGPSYMQETGMSASLSGLVTTIPMLLSLVTGPIGGVILDRFGHPKAMLLAALTVNGIATILLFTTTGIMLWAAAILLGLFGTITFVATLSTIPQVLKNSAAYPTALSLYMFTQCGGELMASVISPMVLGESLNSWTVFAVFLGVCGAIGLGCAAAAKFRIR